MTSDTARVKKVEKATEGVLRWLGFLQQHDLRIGFTDKFDDKLDDDQPDCRSFSGYPYRWARFVFRRPFVDHCSAEDLEALAIHEALHVILFDPLDRLLNGSLSEKRWAEYQMQQERIVDLATCFIDRRRPKYGYHPSGVCHTRKSVTQKTGRSKR